MRSRAVRSTSIRTTQTKAMMTTPAMTNEGSAVPAGERLQKYLARAGVASRRGAEEIIAAGRVRVNGEVVSSPGTRVDPASDEVSVDGAVVRVVDRKSVV